MHCSTYFTYSLATDIFNLTSGGFAIAFTNLQSTGVVVQLSNSGAEPQLGINATMDINDGPRSSI